MVKNGRSLSRLKDVNTNIQRYLTMEDNIAMCNEPNSISELIRRSTHNEMIVPKIPTSVGVRILQVYKLIIIIELMYIMLVPFDWTIKVITKLPNSEQSYKGKVKTHNYINRQNQSTTGKL